MTSNNKKELAKQFGVDSYISSKDLNIMKSIEKSMDIILDTVGAEQDIEPYLDLLKKNGTFSFTLKGCLPDFVIFGDGLPNPAYNVVSNPLKVLIQSN